MNQKDKLSGPEYNHLITLLDNNEYDGWYFGNEDQYWNRAERIRRKLKLYVKEGSDEV